MTPALLLACAVALVQCVCGALAEGGMDLQLTVPASYKAVAGETYICVSMKLPTAPWKLTGIEPLARADIVHHILLFGCQNPHTAQPHATIDNKVVWDCLSHGVCSGSETAMYGWGRNAEPLQMPPGVAYTVGGATFVQHVVMQVHYKNGRPAKDSSGLKLHLQQAPMPHSAGLLTFARYFSIPPGQPHVLINNTCCYRGFQPLTTFAFRVHTHAMGSSVFLSRTPAQPSHLPAPAAASTKAPAPSGPMWEELARRSPQLPQAFVPVGAPAQLWPGDTLRTTCDFNSSAVTYPVRAGFSHGDEMCNLYLMVHSDLPLMGACLDDRAVMNQAVGGMPAPGGKALLDPLPAWRPPSSSSAPNAKDSSGQTTAAAPKDGSAAGPLGDVTGVAMGPDGTVWGLYRGSHKWTAGFFDAQHRARSSAPVAEAVVAQLDPVSGGVLQRWGAGLFVMPHMISLDRHGAVWVVDAGRHQALKFSSEGKLLLEIGTKGEPGDGPGKLCQPTHVAPLNDGGVLVADGYCNGRVARFDAAGKWLADYKEPRMAVVHSVAVDECAGAVYAASRENGLVLSFALSGDGAVRSAADLSAHGRVWALRIGPHGTPLALTWEERRPARLVHVGRSDQWWELPGSEDSWAHDLALGVAPLQASGAGERLLAAYMAPLCAGCALRRYLLLPAGATLPAAALAQPAAGDKAPAAGDKAAAVGDKAATVGDKGVHSMGGAGAAASGASSTTGAGAVAGAAPAGSGTIDRIALRDAVLRSRRRTQPLLVHVGRVLGAALALAFLVALMAHFGLAGVLRPLPPKRSAAEAAAGYRGLQLGEVRTAQQPAGV